MIAAWNSDYDVEANTDQLTVEKRFEHFCRELVSYGTVGGNFNLEKLRTKDKYMVNLESPYSPDLRFVRNWSFVSLGALNTLTEPDNAAKVVFGNNAESNCCNQVLQTSPHFNWHRLNQRPNQKENRE